MLATTAWTGLVLLVTAGDYDASAGQSLMAQRIARVEADLCVSLCPPAPRDPSSEWLRSEEGRKVNACPMACRVDQPAAALFRESYELVTDPSFDPSAAAVTARGKNAPALARRLRAALHDGDGKRLGPLCTRARRQVTPSDEQGFLECVGRIAWHESRVSMATPDGTRGLECATVFAEREVDWLSRCNALEARAGVDACVAGDAIDAAGKPRRHAGPMPRDRCESEAVERLAATFRKGRH